ncbi:hypothetical protein [Mycolicibacterium fortuitum]
MSRRKPTWTPPALPGLRDAQVQAMYRQIDRQRQTLALIEQKLESGQADQIGMPQASAAKNVQKLRDLLPAFEVDAANLAGAQLYWVARKMVQVAVSASPSLPEWTPLAALPAANGLLCWAMSAGQVDGPEGRGGFDAASWAIDGSGLRISLHTKDSLPGWTDTPLAPLYDVLIPEPDQPRREESYGADAAIPALSTLASAWLLMGQERIVETKALADRPGGVRGPAEESGQVPTVSVVDIRTPARAQHSAAETDGRSRTYRRQWWVEGHWRQQPYGPGSKYRRPQWISPYVKGPTDVPMTQGKVIVWRR